jgi:hypothetical protein
MTQYAIKKSGTSEVVGFVTAEGDDAPTVDGEDVEALSTPVGGWPVRPFEGAVLTVTGGVLGWRDDRTIEECKAHKNAEINQKRLTANRTSFPFAGKSIACDELSMLDIQSLNGIVALIGDLPPGFANQWKAIDNTYVAIPDKSTWIAFIGAMVATGQANFDHSQTLKVALAEATTNTDVDAITWE